MRQLRQPQASDHGQQAGIGHGACIVHWLSFAAESKCNRLGTRAACQVVSGVPGGNQRQHQQQYKRNSGRHRTVEKRQGFYKQCAEPIGHQSVKTIGLSQKLRLQPVAHRPGKFTHYTEARNIFGFPGAAAKETRQHVSGAKQYQGHAWQPTHGGLGDQGGRWFVQSVGA